MPKTVAPIRESCWDTDIEAAIIALTSDAVRNYSYWFRTIDLIEEGIDPETNQRITMGGLAAWVTRCKSAPPTPKEAPAYAEPKARSVSPQNRCVCDT